jgi:hypothetical protein
MSRTLRLRIGQRWPEDAMRKYGVIFAQALRTRSFEKTKEIEFYGLVINKQR